MQGMQGWVCAVCYIISPWCTFTRVMVCNSVNAIFKGTRVTCKNNIFKIESTG